MAMGTPFGSFSSPQIDRERDLLDRLSRLEDERDMLAKALRAADPNAYYETLKAIRRGRL